MKPFAIILIVLVLAGVAALGSLYLNANIDVRFREAIATDGITQLEFFETLKSKVSSSAFVGTRFSAEELSSADKYQFLTYTVTLDNHSFLQADVIEIRITPMQGDVLQIGEEAEHSLPSGRQMDLSATILTDRAMHSVREATVSYYCWGIPFTTKLTLGR